MSSHQPHTRIKGQRKGMREPTEEMRLVKTTMLLSARSGVVQALKYLVDGMENSQTYFKLDVFEVFLEHLQGSKVPSVETLPLSFKRTRNGFSEPNVERALLSLQGLQNAYRHVGIICSDKPISELFVARWPDILAWMCYFYVAAFEKNLVESPIKKSTEIALSTASLFVAHINNCDRAMANVPGTIKLATLLCMLESDSKCLGMGGQPGTINLVFLLSQTANSHVLDEVLEAVDGNANVFVDTITERLQHILDHPEISHHFMMLHFSFFESFYRVPKHPLSIAARARSPVVFMTKMLLRILDVPYQSENFVFGDGEGLELSITALLKHTSVALRDLSGIRLALQALQTGILTGLVIAASLTVHFRPTAAREIVETLHMLACHTTHIAVARQASAELEKLDGVCSVQGRISQATPSVRNAWNSFVGIIHSRRTLLAQIQALDSTPMACDNCFRFDERAIFKKCAGCAMAHYCSKDCQSRAWKSRHRAECKTLKNKSAKSKRRIATNSERFFLVCVAINDAQVKKEHLKAMGSVGLRSTFVSVDYTLFPPRISVGCDDEEIHAYAEETTRLMEKHTNVFSLALKEDDFDPEECKASLSDYIKYTSSYLKKKDEAVEAEAIQLLDSDGTSQRAMTLNTPSVLLVVVLPNGYKSREERFVVDDFWEFGQIKFENLESMPESIDPRDTNYSLSEHEKSLKCNPSLEALFKWTLAHESRMSGLLQSIEEKHEQIQNNSLHIVLILGNQRKAVYGLMQELLDKMATLVKNEVEKQVPQVSQEEQVSQRTQIKVDEIAQDL